MNHVTGPTGFKQALRRLRWSLTIRYERLIASLRFRYAGHSETAARGQARRGAESGRSAPLAGRFCGNPFKQIDLEEAGVAYSCCSSWLPTPIGNLNQGAVMDCWNGPVIQKIRESIFDGSFRYCRHDRCPVIQNGELPTLEEAARDPLFTRIINERSTVVERPRSPPTAVAPP